MSNIDKNPSEDLMKMTPSELDEKLGSLEQTRLAEMVSRLPDDTVSMVWRSGLNERLQRVAAKQKRRDNVMLIWRPALGAVVAGVVMLALFAPKAPVGSPVVKGSPSIEAALVRAHHDAIEEDDVAGTGVTTMDLEQDSNPRGPDLGSDSM